MNNIKLMLILFIKIFKNNNILNQYKNNYNIIIIYFIKNNKLTFLFIKFSRFVYATK